MIISNNQVKQVLEAYNKSDGDSTGRNDKKRSGPETSDSSPVTAARQVIGKAPEVREERIKELKDSIRAGHYERTAEEIANKMISRSVVDTILSRDKE